MYCGPPEMRGCIHAVYSVIPINAQIEIEAKTNVLVCVRRELAGQLPS